MERINKWLARLTIAHKLILSSIVFELPIGVLPVALSTATATRLPEGVRRQDENLASE